MKAVLDVHRILRATVTKPVDKQQMRREILMAEMLKYIMSQHPVQYAIAVCPSSREAERLLEHLITKNSTSVENLASDLKALEMGK